MELLKIFGWYLLGYIALVALARITYLLIVRVMNRRTQRRQRNSHRRP